MDFIGVFPAFFLAKKNKQILPSFVIVVCYHANVITWNAVVGYTY